MNSPQITRQEWRWATGWAVALVLLSGLPYLLAALAAPAGWHFAGLLTNPLDGHSYMAKMQQGAAGNWLFHLAYTPEPHPSAFIFTFYLALGHLAALTGLPNPVVFHAARLAAGLGMLLALFNLTAHITPQRQERRVAFWLLLTASGLGWLGALAGAFPIDLWVPEAFTPYCVYANPHFPAGIGLMAFIFTQILRNEPLSIWQVVAVAGAALALAMILPFALLTTWAVLAIFLAQRSVAAGRRLPWKQIWLTLSAGIAAAPVIFYQYWVSVSNPILAGWSAQNVTPAPRVIDFALGYGLVGALAILGGWRMLRQKERPPGEWLILLWAITTVALVYLPFNLQRRLITGLHVPLCILAAMGLVRWLNNRRRSRQVIALVIALSAVGTLFGWSLPLAAALQSPEQSYPASLLFIRSDEQAAFDWLRGHSTPDTVVLASPRVGMFLPGQTGARAYYGHPFETIAAATKRAQAEAFFRGEIAAPPVDFIFYGPTEQALGQPTAFNRLPVVFTAGAVTIYQNTR